jgi:Protein of unknown function (DUF1579)
MAADDATADDATADDATAADATTTDDASSADDATTAALARLTADVGTWDVELTITPAPGAEANHTLGTAVNRLVGGRWLVSDQVTESGFEGHGVYGWDEGGGGYVATWVDIGGAGMARGTGRWQEADRTTTYDMEVTLPNGQTVRYREVTTRVDDDTRTYENLMPAPDGGEHAVIRGTYRRRA